MKTMNQRLLIAAITLSGIALVIATIAPNGWKDKNEAPNFIHVICLAEKIKNRELLQLIDLRPKDQYDQFHLPTAINIPLEEFSGFDHWGAEQIVLYSGDDWLTRKLWNSLSDKQRDQTFLLFGGAYDWYDQVLYPKLPIHPNPNDSLIVEHVHSLSLFYGGQADFVNEAAVMHNYKIDLSQAPWPKPSRQVGLVRKGC